VYLSDAVIIMTSNIGAEKFRKLTSPLGFLNRAVGVQQVAGEVMRELERRFPPEFRNRIDEVVLFAPLTHDEVREIAKHYIQQVTLGRAYKTIDVSEDALEVIVAKGYNMNNGARFLKRFIDEHIVADQRAPKDGRTSKCASRTGDIHVEAAPAKLMSTDPTIAVA
jgi:ATP-dependent Clp protease ATP-binding subunit ClpA